MVTAEMALALASLLAVFTLVVLGFGALQTHASLCQGAREVARLTAVGDTAAAGQVKLPAGASVSVGESGGWVEATGRSSFTGLPIGTLSCTVSTLREPVTGR